MSTNGVTAEGCWHLTVLKHGKSIRQLSLESRSYTIGRHPECDILIADGSVSRHHCTVAIPGDGQSPVVIQDLVSQNGTIVNGERLDPYAPRRLAMGDVVLICFYRLDFFFE